MPFQEFPKWKYPPKGSESKSVMVKDRAEEEALGPDWTDLPPDYVAPDLSDVKAEPAPIPKKVSEYPKWKYPPLGIMLPPQVVNSAKEENDPKFAGWFDAPATLYQPGPSGADFSAQDIDELHRGLGVVKPNADDGTIVDVEGDKVNPPPGDDLDDIEPDGDGLDPVDPEPELKTSEEPNV